MSMKKTIFQLFFLLAVLSSLWCCRNEDFATENPSQQSSNMSAAKFASKSFWKEDEVYIRKVQQVFLREANLENVKNRYGELYWDYAMSFGQFGESYLLVPVVKNNKVVLLMEAVRIGDKVHFYQKEDRGLIDFFHATIFSNIISYDEKTGSQNKSSSRNAPTFECTTRWLTVGCNDNEPNCTPYIRSETVCKYVPGTTPKTFPPIGTDGGGGGGADDGYQYPDPPEIQNPCEKLKTQNSNSNFKAKISQLESNLGLKKETGYVEKTNGTFEYKDNASATENANSLTLGEPTSDMKGYMHTHPNDFEDSDGNMRIGFKIFSPADVIYFNQMVALALQNGTPLEEIYAVMVSGKGTYQIRFTGNENQIKTSYTNTKDEYNKMYIKYFEKYKDRSDEINFLKFMDEQMYVKGITLVKMNNDGTTTKKTLNSTKTGVTDDTCPQ